VVEAFEDLFQRTVVPAKEVDLAGGSLQPVVGRVAPEPALAMIMNSPPSR
jgi:hypothetical protein